MSRDYSLATQTLYPTTCQVKGLPCKRRLVRGHQFYRQAGNYCRLQNALRFFSSCLQVAGVFCMELAMKKAKEVGVAWVTCTGGWS